MRKSRNSGIKQLRRAVREENRYSTRDTRVRTARQLKSPLRRLYEIPFRVAWGIAGRSLFEGDRGPVALRQALPKVEFLARQARLNKVKPLHAEQEFKRIQQSLPRSSKVCIQRQTRRQVIFAMGHHGSGVRRPRKRKLQSRVVCR